MIINTSQQVDKKKYDENFDRIFSCKHNNAKFMEKHTNIYTGFVTEIWICESCHNMFQKYPRQDFIPFKN